MEIAATITKADLAQLSRSYGGRNTKEFRGHEPGTLIFVTFAGRIDLQSKNYVGKHIIEVADSPPIGNEPAFDFHMLPRIPTPSKGQDNASNDQQDD